MTHRLAKIISIIFHPLLVPTYALLLLINLQTHTILALPVNYRYIIVVMVFLATFVIPSIIIFILLKAGKIKSLEMHSRQERILPMIIISVSFYVTYYLFKQTAVSGLMSLFMIGATILALLSLIINYITKISLHMMAWGGLFGTFLGFAINFHYNLTSLLFIIILITGTIGAARLRLNVHTPAQVYSGFLLGTTVMILIFYMI
ncbi:MAG: hypothetical protein H8E34_06195 [Bacteroidetes bacterium]|nr:hypothetical protein [Bacteroidota bacterium]MBL6944704.1 hypothetical protein [Bacteroidales bacterium]